MSDYSFLAPLSASAQDYSGGGSGLSVWDGTSGKIISFYAGTNVINAKIGTVNLVDGSISYGSELTNAVTSLTNIIEAHYDIVNARGIVVYYGNTDDVRAKVFTSDGSVLTWGAEATINTTDDYHIGKLVFNSTDSSYIYYGVGATRVGGYGMTISGTTITVGSETTIKDVGAITQYPSWGYWDTSTNRAVLSTVSTSPTTELYIQVVSMSGTTLTVTATTTITGVADTTNYACGGACYVDSLSKGVFYYSDTSIGTPLGYITTGASSISVTNSQKLSPSPINEDNYSVPCIYDTESELVYFGTRSKDVTEIDGVSGIDVSDTTNPVSHIHGSYFGDIIKLTTTNVGRNQGYFGKINSTRYFVNDPSTCQVVIMQKITPEPTPSRLTSYLVRTDA